MAVLLLNGCSGVPVKTNCQATKMTIVRFHNQGYPTRIGHGYFNGNPHRWVEYFVNGKGWLVYEDTIYYINSGYKLKEYGGSYDVNWYED